MLRVWYPFLCPPAFRACAIGAAPIGDGCARTPPPASFLLLLLPSSLVHRSVSCRWFVPCADACEQRVPAWRLSFAPLGLRRSRRGHCDPLPPAGFSPFDKGQKRRVASAWDFRLYNRIDHLRAREGDYSPPLRGGCSLPLRPVESRPAAPGRCGRRPPVEARPKERPALVTVPSAARTPFPATFSPPWNNSNKGRRGWGMSPRRGH